MAEPAESVSRSHPNQSNTLFAIILGFLMLFIVILGVKLIDSKSASEEAEKSSSSLEEQLTAKTNELATATQKLEENSAAAQQASTQLVETKSELETANTEKGQFQNKITVLESSLEKLKQENNALVTHNIKVNWKRPIKNFFHKPPL